MIDVENPRRTALTGGGRVPVPVGPSKDLPLKEADEHHCNARNKKSLGYCQNLPGFRCGGLPAYNEKKGTWRRCYLHGGMAPGKGTSITRKDGSIGLYDEGISVKDMATYEASFDEPGLENEVAVARTQVADIAIEMKGLQARAEQAMTRVVEGWTEEDKRQVMAEFKSMCQEMGMEAWQAKDIWMFFTRVQKEMGDRASLEIGSLKIMFGREKDLRKMILHFLDVVGRLRERDQKLKNDLSLTVGYKDVMELIALLGKAVNDVCATCANRMAIAEMMQEWRPWATKDLRKEKIEEAIVEKQGAEEDKVLSLSAGKVGKATLGFVGDEDNGEEEVEWDDDEPNGFEDD